MHEFSLYGQVANVHHDKVLKQLAGVTRMQPQHVLERHIIFKAKSPIGLNYLPSGGGSQGVLSPELQRTRQMLLGSLYYVQLVCDLEKIRAGREDEIEGESMAKNGSGSSKSDSGALEKKGNHRGQKVIPKPTRPAWTFEFRDIPDPGKQAVTTRQISKTATEADDAFRFVEDLGFEYISHHVIQGHRFYDGDITLFLHKVLKEPPYPDKQKIQPDHSLPNLIELQPLDHSGGYVLQASIEALDGNNPDVKEKAAELLLAMKETLKQTVPLAIGDRLALDTRVPMRNVGS